VAQILVRDIEESVKTGLQQRAVRHGRSIEAEVRDILRDATRDEQPRSGGLGRDIAALFEGIGLAEGEAIEEFRGYDVHNPLSP
jgi:plasmid stability protein